jgi:hypothetical protein
MREALATGRIRAAYADHNQVGLPLVRYVPLSHWRNHDPYAECAIVVTSAPGGKPISEIVVIEANDFWDWLSEIAAAEVPDNIADAAATGESVPPDQGPIYRTGAAGRPTSWALVNTEVRRRWGPETRGRKTAEWARIMFEWLQSEHPKAAPMTEKTLKNKLPDLLRELRAADQKASAQEPEMK